jgi:hypothetical protein
MQNMQKQTQPQGTQVQQFDNSLKLHEIGEHNTGERGEIGLQYADDAKKCFFQTFAG